MVERLGGEEEEEEEEEEEDDDDRRSTVEDEECMFGTEEVMKSDEGVAGRLFEDTATVSLAFAVSLKEEED